MPIRSDIYNYFVGIRACLKMNRLKEAITWCEMGLAVSYILGLLLGRFHGNSFFFLLAQIVLWRLHGACPLAG